MKWVLPPGRRIGKKLDNTQRPALGSSIIASAVMTRSRFRRVDQHFARQWMRDDKRVEGVYIGFRTTWDGNTDYEEEVGIIFIPEKFQELWLVVFDPRRSPVYARPEDCIWEK